MKVNDNDMDLLLRRALSSTEAPDAELIQKVKYKLGKADPVLKRACLRFSFRTVAVTIIVLILLTTTACAVWNLLKPYEVAEKFSDKTLSKAFESEDALIINESITSGDYSFTLLGVVSGKGLTDMPSYSDGIVQFECSYVVVAIQKADGTPMPSTQSEEYVQLSFFNSPLVKGINPLYFNIFELDGACTYNVINGIMYRLVECDQFDIFADRGLYFAVCTEGDELSPFDAFIYNEQTGEVKANPDYDGSCAVFDLPIDPKSADPNKAEQYLNGLLP